MGTIIILLLIGMTVLYLIHLSQESDSKPARPVGRPDDGPIREAQRTLQAAIEVCNTDHAAAAQALLWLAGTDGTISKQEARNLFRFCEKQGSTLPAGTSEALEYLNSGMTIQSGRTEREVQNDLADIAARPIPYRAAFLGAAHAICGGNKRISKTKQDFLDRVAQLVEEPVA